MMNNRNVKFFINDLFPKILFFLFLYKYKNVKKHILYMINKALNASKLLVNLL